MQLDIEQEKNRILAKKIALSKGWFIHFEIISQILF